MDSFKKSAWSTTVTPLAKAPRDIHESQQNLVLKDQTNDRTKYLAIIVILVGVIALTGLVVGIITLVTVEEPATKVTEEQSALTNEPLETTEIGPEICLTKRTTTNCSTDANAQKYRTYDGTCNNQFQPLWGASEIPFKRLLAPIYEDGINTPIGWDSTLTYNGFLLPSARKVSQEVMSASNITTHMNYTDLVMVWGQYIDHDTDHTPKTNSRCTDKCTQSAPYCFPVFPPANDSRLAETACISLTRSTPVCNEEPRQQLNSVTSYIDASMVYGSTEERALYLRDFTTELGHLREGISVNVYGKVSKPLMPFVHDTTQACMKPNVDDTGIPCFFAGDVRANEHLGLIALHTLWVREHNRIADRLFQMNNSSWSGETIYQETRKIVGALHQIITYKHWLPKIIGNKGIELLGDYTSYEPLVEASVDNSFATATFRFGHAQISPTVFRLGSDFQESPDGNLVLHDAAFCPFRIVNEGSIDPVLRGMFGTALKDIDSEQLMTDEVTENLFKLSNTIPFDLASLNIQRGREHGLPGYNSWRQFCSLSVANTFDDLANEISNADVRQKLEDLYGHPSNVDLFVAGLAEDPWFDSILGPTFTCLIAHQFRALRAGDRYWYENTDVFTPEQVTELEKHSLARILCDSGDDIQEVQSDIFQTATYPDDYLMCGNITTMDLQLWDE